MRSVLPSDPTAPTVGGTFHAGDRVAVQWHGSGWPGRIIGVEGADRHRITYDSDSSSWDETLGPDRLCPQ